MRPLTLAVTAAATLGVVAAIPLATAAERMELAQMQQQGGQGASQQGSAQRDSTGQSGASRKSARGSDSGGGAAVSTKSKSSATVGSSSTRERTTIRHRTGSRAAVGVSVVDDDPDVVIKRKKKVKRYVASEPSSVVVKKKKKKKIGYVATEPSSRVSIVKKKRVHGVAVRGGSVSTKSTVRSRTSVGTETRSINTTKSLTTEGSRAGAKGDATTGRSANQPSGSGVGSSARPSASPQQ